MSLPLSNTGQELYIYVIWQEDWTKNPLAWSKYVQGKIVYQKSITEMEYFTRPFRIEDKDVNIGVDSTEEGPYGPAVLPSATIKDMDSVFVSI